MEAFLQARVTIQSESLARVLTLLEYPQYTREPTVLPVLSPFRVYMYPSTHPLAGVRVLPVLGVAVLDLGPALEDVASARTLTPDLLEVRVPTARSRSAVGMGSRIRDPGSGIQGQESRVRYPGSGI